MAYRVHLLWTRTNDHEKGVGADQVTNVFRSADVLGVLLGKPRRWEEFFLTAVVQNVLEQGPFEYLPYLGSSVVLRPFPQ